MRFYFGDFSALCEEEEERFVSMDEVLGNMTI